MTLWYSLYSKHIKSFCSRYNAAWNFWGEPSSGQILPPTASCWVRWSVVKKSGCYWVCVFLLLCIFHKRLECIVLLIFICLSLPSSLIQLCSRVAICQLLHTHCVSCSDEHTCHLVVGPHTNVWCSFSLLWCFVSQE